MEKKVLIPHRGVIALDIITSLNSIGLETILMHSPEDSLSLPVKLADRSFKFFSSRLEDSYLDMEAILEKAIELDVDYIHPGYGFLAENPEFARLCEENHIQFIGPNHEVLSLVEDKVKLRKVAAGLGINILTHSSVLKSALDFNSIMDDFGFPLIIKPLKGYGGRGIRVVHSKREAKEQIDHMLSRVKDSTDGVFLESFMPKAHHIEIPFFRDVKGNILFLPEIESSIQRRFQKLFQESPSININEGIRQSMYLDSQRLIEEIEYIGLGYIEFIVEHGVPYFLEINPTFHINSLIPEIHIIANFIKKQIAISSGELLHHVEGIEIVKPNYHILLVSLMAENPFNNFQPSAGTVTEFFYYSSIRNLFKTTLYKGARISPMYDPYIGKIVTFSKKREYAIRDMRRFLDSIFIRGIQTNLIFLKHLLDSPALKDGDTIIDFLSQKFNFAAGKKSDQELEVAASLLAAVFHVDNRKENYKAELEKMKQPGLLRRLFGKF